jgi:hypothetical protein
MTNGICEAEALPVLSLEADRAVFQGKHAASRVGQRQPRRLPFEPDQRQLTGRDCKTDIKQTGVIRGVGRDRGVIEFENGFRRRRKVLRSEVNDS